MSRTPAPADPSPRGKPFPFVVYLALAVLPALFVAACQGDGGGGTPAAAAAPAWTGTRSLPAGELIVFEQVLAGAEDRDLYVVGADGGDPALLRSPGDYPHWSPDGSRLAFLACLNPPDCTTAVALLERSTGKVDWFPMPDPELETPCPIWAPTGRRLACGALSENDPTRNGVYTIRASDGKGLTRITTNPGGEDSPLAFSPDGDQLLLSRFDPSRGSAALFVTPVRGGQPHRITPWGFADDSAGWSPDGRTIVFGTNGWLYRVSPDGQRRAKIALRLPDGSAVKTAFDVSFSPDGERIVFSIGTPAPGIYQARLDGSVMQRLTSGEHHHANWGAASAS